MLILSASSARSSPKSFPSLYLTLTESEFSYSFDIKSNKIDQVLLSHMSFVEERYQEESIDISRPLMRPEDYVYQIQEIQSYIDSSKQIAFASDNTLIDSTKDKEIQLKELVEKYFYDCRILLSIS